MTFAKTTLRRWKYLETLVFIFVFGYIFYYLITGFSQYSWATFSGKGFIYDFTNPIHTKEFYKCFLSVIGLLTSFYYLWEIGKLFIEVLKKEKNIKWSRTRLFNVFKEVRHRYQPTFLSSYFGELLTKLIVLDVFWILLPYFQKISLFTINFEWYSWIYAYLIWELSMWTWHYGAHKIRLFWCLHSPHHAPEELNMTVAWVHFFAEGYYSAAVQLVILMFLGVQPAMLLVIMSIETMWGTFIHAGERSFKDGRFGIMQKILITPSHHRVHHAKNPLYMDRNFCSFLPFWDWLFGTLQPQKKEIKIEYGITRKIDVINFVDFYFGECFLLYKDVKDAKGLKNKILFMVKPPGWSPESVEHTAATVRANFIKENPELGYTSKDFLLNKIRKRRIISVEDNMIENVKTI
ncbi:MAG: sterol desaturase family protein [Chitinophagaceae bacterium]|nr:sterol desaturase family protein [Chitinophagaceae bacterium]